MSEYRILELASREDMQKLIAVCFKEGWRCQGGITIYDRGNGDFRYVQAMVRGAESNR